MVLLHWRQRACMPSPPIPNQATGCLNIDQKYWHPSPVPQRNFIFFPRSYTVFALSKLSCWRTDYTLITPLQRQATKKKKHRKRISNEGEMRWYIICSLQGCLSCIHKPEWNQKYIFFLWRTFSPGFFPDGCRLDPVDMFENPALKARSVFCK